MKMFVTSLIFICVCIGCNPDIFLDKQYNIEGNVYVYHQNGQKGFYLSRKVSKDGFEYILDDTVSRVVLRADTIYALTIENYQERYFWTNGSGFQVEETSEQAFRRAENDGKIMFPKQ